MTGKRDEGTGNMTASFYWYDSAGRRIAKSESGLLTLYIWDGMDIIATANADGSIREYYTRGIGIAGDVGSLVAEMRFENGVSVSTTYLHSNWRGDVVMATDSSGAVIGEYAYTTFGEQLSSSGSYTPRFTFSSKESDASGLVYFGFRYYSPVLCRWISADPIGEAGGINLYQFCRNNPVNRVDLDGYAPQLIGVNDKGDGTYSSDRDWGDYDPQWGGRRNPYGNKRGVYSWGCYAKQEGEKYGWPYAHVLANAGITRDHGASTAWTVSLMKEVIDTIKGLSGNPDSLYSAWQPSDFEMNQIGRSIPPSKTPEQWAEPYKNTPEGAPGPLYKWLY
jgi:RHS repeat-associated protein